jgi:hypothetical protein
MKFLSESALLCVRIPNRISTESTGDPRFELQISKDVNNVLSCQFETNHNILWNLDGHRFIWEFERGISRRR